MFSLSRIIISALICISFFACTDSGNTPVNDIRSVEVHSDILVSWAKGGVRDAVVVHIDAHDDIRSIAAPKIKELKELMQKGDWQGFERVNTLADDGLYNVGNFLYAGARLGIVKDIYWVIPFPIFQKKNPVPMLQDMLRLISFSEDDIATFSFKDGRYSGKYQGVSLTICGIGNLPDINEPVLLSIDIDYFPEYVRTYSSTFTDAVSSLFGAFFDKRYKVREAVVSDSVSGGFLKPRHRWVGDLIEEVMQRPDIISNGFPERYIQLQGIETQIQRGAFTRAIELVNPLVSDRDDPALKVYQAETLFRSGLVDAALTPAFDACRNDNAYCYELPYIGIALTQQGRPWDAVRFFSLGYDINSSMDSGQVEYGIALEALGRKKDALAAFNKHRERHGSFPVDFMITAFYIHTGEGLKALETLQYALENMGLERDINTSIKPLAEAILTIAGFCKANGYSKELALLEDSSLAAAYRKAFPALFQQ